MFVLGGSVSTGDSFTSFTISVKLFVSLNGGVPLSVTRIITGFVLGPCVSVGVHVIAPPADTANPAGPLTSAKVSVCAGTSRSEARGEGLESGYWLLLFY